VLRKGLKCVASLYVRILYEISNALNIAHARCSALTLKTREKFRNSGAAILHQKNRKLATTVFRFRLSDKMACL
jgi:hypothetical protein